MSLAVNLSPAQSEQLIFQQLIGAGFPDQFAKLATAQSGHETGGWVSNVYHTDNNAFGYGYTGSGYREYNGVEDSVNDFVIYVNNKIDQGKFPPLDQIQTPNDWAALLKNVGYYTDSQSNYAAGISRFLNNNLAAIAVSAGFIIFGAILLYFLIRKH